jgi:hypothetical protein
MQKSVGFQGDCARIGLSPYGEDRIKHRTRQTIKPEQDRKVNLPMVRMAFSPAPQKFP